MADIKWSAFPTQTNLVAGDSIVGLHSGANTLFTSPFGNLGFTGNTLLSTNTNGSIVYQTNGTGQYLFGQSGGVSPSPSSNAIITVGNPGTALSIINLFSFLNSASASILAFTKTRSTTIGSFSVVQANDAIGQISWSADTGTTFSTRTSVVSRVTTVGSFIGSNLTFNTSSSTSLSNVTALTISDVQLVTVNQGALSLGTVAGQASSTITIFTPTASMGSLAVTSANNSGNFANVLTNSSTTAARTWTLPDASGTIALTSGSIILANITPITNASSPYTVLATDQVITTDSTAGAITINLPNAPSTGRIITIKDLNGTAATNAITVTTVGGTVTLDGNTSMVFQTAFFERAFIFNGTNYNIIDSYYGPIVGAPKNVNTSVGVSAGNSTYPSSTTNSTLVGYQTGLNLTSSGVSSTFVGYQAGTANTSGARNTFIGASSGITNQTGADNVAIGYQALTLATVSSLVAIGSQTGAAHTSGSSCVYVGFQAGNANQTGSQISCFGSAAGKLTTATNGTFIGYSAGAGATSGTGNTFVGSTSGMQSTGTGGNNVCIGTASGTALTNGNSNTAVGSGSLGAITTNGSNVAIGTNCMSAATGAAQNTAIGTSCLQNITTSNIVSIGFTAGQTHTSGTGCTYIGFAAGKTNSTGTNITAIGSSALTLCTAGPNTAFGFSAGSALTTGTSNILIGSSAGTNYTSSESANILIGSGVTGTAAESNVLRIGIGTGTSTGQLNSAFIQGITGVTQNPSASNSVVTIVNSTGQIGVTVATATPTASKLPLWDASVNLSANNFLPGYATFTTSQTLTAASSYSIYMTGTTAAQTMTLPVVSTFAATGAMFMFMNNSTQTWNINSSGANLVIALPSMSMVIVECILITGTTAASWNAMPITFGTTTGTGNTMVLQNAPNITGRTTGSTPTSGNIGEELQTVVASGSAVSLTTATIADITSQAYTAGNWLVVANPTFVGTGITATELQAFIGTASGNVTTGQTTANTTFGTPFIVGATAQDTPFICWPFNTSGTGTLFLKAKATFSVGTCAAYGALTLIRLS